MPEITPQLNDGVVNSARQIVNLNEEELAGFVVADHADVLGHYDRQDGLIAGRPFNAGLFHSGAGFGDPQFFELYRRVAQEILHTRTRVRRARAARLAAALETAANLAAAKRATAKPAATKRAATKRAAAKRAAAKLARIGGRRHPPAAGAKPRATKRAARRRKGGSSTRRP
jgi:hypothetical protein